MSIIGIVREDLGELETDALKAAKTTLSYIDGVIVHDVAPAILQKLVALIEQLGEAAVEKLLGNAPLSAAPQPPADL